MNRFVSYDQFKKMNESDDVEDFEIENDDFEVGDGQEEQQKGTLMAYFDIPNWDELLAQISPEDVYGEESKFGLEREPHATILYGFEIDKTTPDDIVESIESLQVEPLTDIEIKGVGKFENEEYDVLKLTIDSPKLRELNSYFKENFDYDNDYPDYSPHITIAYINKGEVDKYLDIDISLLLVDPETEEEIPLTSDLLVYSESNDADESAKTQINLVPLENEETGDVEGEEIEDNLEDAIEDLDEE